MVGVRARLALATGLTLALGRPPLTRASAETAAYLAEARMHFRAALDAFATLGAEVDAAKVRQELAALA